MQKLLYLFLNLDEKRLCKDAGELDTQLPWCYRKCLSDTITKVEFFAASIKPFSNEKALKIFHEASKGVINGTN